MELPLTGKVAFVTGASRGIGEAIAAEFAKQGAYVFGTATSDHGSKKITERLNGAGEGITLDIVNREQCEAVFKQLDSQGKLPDILVNNAGICRDGLLLRMSEDDWQQVIDTNLTGVFALTKLFLKPMLKKQWGRIISIASITALRGNPGQCNYAAAKAGVIGFSKSLALEVASRNITANVIAPGYIETDMTASLSEEQREAILKFIPAGDFGQPEDIAAAVAFLASPAARYITGETIQISGGLYT